MTHNTERETSPTPHKPTVEGAQAPSPATSSAPAPAVDTIGADPAPPVAPSPSAPQSELSPPAAESAPSPALSSTAVPEPAVPPSSAAAAGAAHGSPGSTPAPAAHAPAPTPTPAPPAIQPAPYQAPPHAGAADYSPALIHLSLPNLLTATRCFGALLIIVMLAWPWGPFLTGALIVFGLAAATDWLDGRIARAWRITSELGRMLDHIADKLLIGVTMLMMCAIGLIDGLNVIAAALILARELAVSGLREHLSVRGVVLPASQMAKWKTTFQMVALAALMAAPLAPIEEIARFTGLVILWLAMVMTIVSGIQYAMATRDAWDER